MGQETGDREYLVTGVTGFVGKVVLAELMRRREELRVGAVHVMIRPGNGLSAQMRFERRILSSDCFRELPRGWHEHVRIVSCELVEEDCGISPRAHAELTGRVTHVIHCAAAIDFDLPVATAAEANIASSLNVLELARACRKLVSMVTVSTAYVTPGSSEGKVVHERLAPLPRPAEAIYQDILDAKVPQDELLDETEHPNTYTLTKCLAEHLQWERRGSVPLVIVRPSIISACLRYPFRGWIDSNAAFAGFVTMIAAGELRAVVARPTALLDIVPCDEVVTRIIDEGLSPPPNGSTRIIHATAGLVNCARVDTCREVIMDFFARRRVSRRANVTYLGPQGLRFRLRDWFHHRLRGATARLWYGLTGQLALRRRVRSLMERLDYLNRVFPYFTQRTFDFRSSAPLDRDIFDATDYLRTVCLGVHRHLLRRNENETTFAGRLNEVRSDLRWAMSQPHGNWVMRVAAYLVMKGLRRCSDRFTLDLPSFEAAREAAGATPIVILPSHRSYMDFVLCSLLFFARPDLEIPIPRIAAADDFARIPILGRLFTRLGAFYLVRGRGEEDPELTRRVHDLHKRGDTLEFFIEGTRSRSRQFLQPRRGLLRCLQSTGERFAILPVALTYDRVPEEASFLEELAGAPKPKMTLLPLLGWTLRLFRREIDVGRVHLTCGGPILIEPDGDAHAVSRQVIAELQRCTATTTHQLASFLAQNPIDGVDVIWLRDAVLRRGGRVLESDLSRETPRAVERCMRYDWAHLFFPELCDLFPRNPAVRYHVKRNGHTAPTEVDRPMELADPRLRRLLHDLFEPVCRDYMTVVESLGAPPVPPPVPSAAELARVVAGAHLPALEEAFQDLVEREILAREPETGRYIWGMRADDLGEYRKACAWPGLPGELRHKSIAELG